MDGLTVCHARILGAGTPARRYDDWRVSDEKFTGQFDYLCKECERRAAPDYVPPQPVPPRHDRGEDFVAVP